MTHKAGTKLSSSSESVYERGGGGGASLFHKTPKAVSQRKGEREITEAELRKEHRNIDLMYLVEDESTERPSFYQRMS